MFVQCKPAEEPRADQIAHEWKTSKQAHECIDHKICLFNVGSETRELKYETCEHDHDPGGALVCKVKGGKVGAFLAFACDIFIIVYDVALYEGESVPPQPADRPATNARKNITGS